MLKTPSAGLIRASHVFSLDEAAMVGAARANITDKQMDDRIDNMITYLLANVS